MKVKKNAKSYKLSLQFFSDKDDNNSTSEENNQNSDEVEEVNEKPKRSMKKPAFLGGGIIAVLLLGIGYWYFFGMTDKQQYFLAEQNTMSETYEDWSDTYGDALGMAEKMEDSAYKQQVNLTGNVSGNDLPMIVQTLLSTMSIQMDTQVNPESEEAQIGVDLLMNEESVIGASIYQSEDYVATTLPLLNSETYFMQNENFGYIARQVDPAYDGPEDLKDILFLPGELTRTSETQKVLFKEYSEFIYEYLESDHFTQESNVAFAGGEYYQLTLHLSDEQLKDFLYELIDKMKNDDELLKIFNDQLTALDDQEDYSIEFIDGLNEMQSNLHEFSIPEGLTSTIYLDGKTEIVGREWNVTFADPEDKDMGGSLSYEMSKEEDGDQEEIRRNLTMSEVGQESGNAFEFVMDTSKSETDDGEKVVTDLGFTMDEAGQPISAGINLDTLRSTGEATTTITLESSEMLDAAGIGEFSVVVRNQYNEDNDGYEQNTELDINAGIDDMYAGYQEYTVNLNFNTDLEFTEDLELITVDAETATNVSELSEEEWMILMEEVMMELETLMYETFGGM
ncbi:hypothetical protein [Salipaludibacillus sp. CF4.18]|uniref:hypothetical protein n=1 Tax=Salipaludibacillus sp. CF4.18 TaxID=3373081 RepID=UPI003EE4AB05